MFNDGGHLFPQLTVEVIADNVAVQHVEGGASLWDLYAAAALAGYLFDSRNDTPDGSAEYAADCADAMIAEREKRRASKTTTHEIKENDRA